MKRYFSFGMIMLLLSSFIACSSVQPTAPTATPIVTINQTSDLDQLQFLPAESGERLKSLDRCVRQTAIGAEWKHQPYEVIGNSFQAKWCRGTGATADCFQNEQTRGVQMIKLSTQQYEQRFPPTCYGYQLTANWIEQGAGYNAYVWVEQGKLGEPDQTAMRFGVLWRQVDVTGNISTTALIDTKQSYTILVKAKNPDGMELSSETLVDVTFDQASETLMQTVLASPAELQRVGLEQLAALETNVEATILGDELNACNWQKYNNDGIKPDCNPRPATDAERQAALATMRQEFTLRRAILEDHATDLYDALYKAFPWETCWKP